MSANWHYWSGLWTRMKSHRMLAPMGVIIQGLAGHPQAPATQKRKQVDSMRKCAGSGVHGVH
eukprot:9621318-Karenia_brevis.AAC.1